MTWVIIIMWKCTWHVLQITVEMLVSWTLRQNFCHLEIKMTWVIIIMWKCTCLVLQITVEMLIGWKLRQSFCRLETKMTWVIIMWKCTCLVHQITVEMLTGWTCLSSGNSDSLNVYKLNAVYETIAVVALQESCCDVYKSSAPVYTLFFIRNLRLLLVQEVS